MKATVSPVCRGHRIIHLSFFPFIFFLLSFVFSPALGQTPQGFTYQALAVNGSGEPIRNQALPVRITIQSDTLGGTIFWYEEHAGVTTNATGLFTLVVGKGSRISGTATTFADIDWSVTPKYIKTEILDGTWKAMGSSRLWSVPYAMTAADITGSLKKLEVAGDATAMDEALFEVKNKNGQTVFAVYNEGVRIYVGDGSSKAVKGGFAIGSFDESKADTLNLLVVNKDSVRVYIYDDPLNKAVKGGFGIGGFDESKGVTNDYMLVSPDSIRMYIDKDGTKAVKGGFAIGSFDESKAMGQEYLRVTNDSVRIYIDDQAKAVKGGFGIGGFDESKAGGKSFFDVNTSSLGTVNPSENRILWYPVKNAFLTGKVLIERADSVGINSFASGFESKAKGQYSQALGYKAIARGDYSTAIGKNAVAHRHNSFAFGDQARALGESSFAFGYLATANTAHSVAIGIGSSANGYGAVSIGLDAYTNNNAAFAAGSNSRATGSVSTAMGSNTQATGGISTAMGRTTVASGNISVAMGDSTIAPSLSETVIGSYNTKYTPAGGSGTWNTNDRLFVVGNGTMFNRKDALILYKNGQLSLMNDFRIRNSSYGAILRNDNSSLWLLFTSAGSPDGSFNSLRPFRIDMASGNVSLANYTLHVEHGNNVGVGTTSPSHKLHVAGDARLGNSLYQSGSIEVNGLGSGNRYSYIDFQGDDVHSDFSLRLMRHNTGSNAYSRLHHKGDGPLQIYTENNAPVTFYTANTHRMTISAGGDVGIGTASPTYPLQVTGSEASNYVARFENTNTATPHGIAVIVADHGDPVAFVGCKTQADHLGGLYANTSGNIYLSGTSDARVKNSITDTEINAVDLIQKLKVRDFFYNNRPASGKTTGFIAQEVLEILPDMVIYDREKDLYMVARDFLVPYLTKAVQEQQQIIDGQNNRIEEQQVQVEQLKAANRQTLGELQSLKAEVEALKAIIMNGNK